MDAQYTYTVFPCLTESKRGFSADAGLTVVPNTVCQTGEVTLGSSGSSSSCSRQWNVLIAQMQLPDISGSSVTSVTLNFATTTSSGGGVPIVLHGLGARSLDYSGGSESFHGGYPLRADYGALTTCARSLH